MINYGTLRNLFSKEKWSKGKSKALLQQAFIETSDEKIDRHLKHIKYEEGKKAIKEHKDVIFVGEDEEDLKKG